LSAVKEYLSEGTNLKLVRFVLFSQSTYDMYKEALVSLE